MHINWTIHKVIVLKCTVKGCEHNIDALKAALKWMNLEAQLLREG